MYSRRADGVGLDQLLGGPEPVSGRVDVDPDELTLADARLHEPRQVRTLGRSHDDDVFARSHGGLERRRQQAPFQD
jgi:hypothetical protein